MIVERLTAQHVADFARDNPHLDQALLTSSSFVADITTPSCGAMAGLTPDRVPVLISGITDQGGGRAFCWQWTGHRFRQYRFGAHRAVSTILRYCTLRRLEMHVDPREPAHVKWAYALGFKFESNMHSFYPDGAMCYMFVRIR